MDVQRSKQGLLRDVRGASVLEIALMLAFALAVVAAIWVLVIPKVQRALQSEGNEIATACIDGKCPDGRSCFVAGTPVATPGGLRPIESIHAGDSVLSRDEATGALVVRRAIRAFVTPNASIVEVRIQEQPDGILCTSGHPFYSVDRGWVEASALRPGEPVFSAAGGPIHVVATRRLGETQTVYNFEVEGTHTYFVGTSLAWVHNPDNCDVAVPNTRPAGAQPLQTVLSSASPEPSGASGSDSSGPPSPGASDPSHPRWKGKQPVRPGLPTDGAAGAQAAAPPGPPQPPPHTVPYAPGPEERLYGWDQAAGRYVPVRSDTIGSNKSEFDPADPADIDHAFLQTLHASPWWGTLGIAGSVGGAAVRAAAKVAGHIVPGVPHIVAAVTAPPTLGIAAHTYKRLSNQIGPQIAALDAVRLRIPPDRQYDPERAAITFTILKLTHALDVAREKTTKGFITGAGTAADISHLGLVNQIYTLPAQLYAARKVVTGTSGAQAATAAYILGDQAFLNNSRYATEAIEALYGPEHAKQLRAEWRKVYAVQAQLREHDASGALGGRDAPSWSVQDDFIDTYYAVNIEQRASSQRDSGPPRFDVSVSRPINGPVLNRPPGRRPPRARLVPVGDYSNEAIKSAFGDQYLPPRSKTQKGWSLVRTRIPFLHLRKRGTPDNLLVASIANKLGGKPTVKPPTVGIDPPEGELRPRPDHVWLPLVGWRKPKETSTTYRPGWTFVPEVGWAKF